MSCTVVLTITYATVIIYHHRISNKSCILQISLIADGSISWASFESVTMETLKFICILNTRNKDFNWTAKLNECNVNRPAPSNEVDYVTYVL